jgi:hypothetical protein
MDYEAIKTAVSDFSHRDDLAAKADTFIDLCEARMNQVLRLTEMCLVATTTIADEYTALPSDFLEMRNIRVNASPVYALEYRAPHSLVQLISGMSGLPKYYTIQSDSIQTEPPGIGTEIEMNYIAQIPALSSSNTTNVISNEHPDIYLHGVLYYAAIFTKNRTAMQMHGSEFERLMDDLNNRENSRRYSGGPIEIVSG